MKDLKKHWTIIAAVLIAAIAYMISMYCFQLMIVHGDSMYPTLKNMHFAVIDRRVRSFEPGDVIVFRCDGLNSTLVKRVVGCPGDTVMISDGKLYVNGAESELYQKSEIDYPGLLSSGITLQDGEYAVLGDNLPESKDSRYEEVGIINAEDISGRVIL